MLFNNQWTANGVIHPNEFVKTVIIVLRTNTCRWWLAISYAFPVDKTSERVDTGRIALPSPNWPFSLGTNDPFNTWFHWASRVHMPNGTSIGSAVLQDSRSCPADRRTDRQTDPHYNLLRCVTTGRIGEVADYSNDPATTELCLTVGEASLSII